MVELDLTGTFKLGSSAALLQVTSRADPTGVGGHESLAVPAVTVRVTVPGTATGTAVAAGGDHATMLSGTARTGIPGARAGRIRNPTRGRPAPGRAIGRALRRTPAVAGY
jgi:hypothetical protein